MAKIALIISELEMKTQNSRRNQSFNEREVFGQACSYAKRTCDKIFVLSSKYGLIDENISIEPYIERLEEKSPEDQMEWLEQTTSRLKEVSDIIHDEFMIIANKTYSKLLRKKLKKCIVPLKDTPISKWIPTFEIMIQKEDDDLHCKTLHRFFNELPRLDWRKIDRVPYENGIYIVFEKYQRYEKNDRVVYVGAHKEQNMLKKELKELFLLEDSSKNTFRKNIGEAILNKEMDPYLSVWQRDDSEECLSNEYKCILDKKKESEIEEKISCYLKEYMTFVCIPVEGKEDRLRFTDGMIATFLNTWLFMPDCLWFGEYSPLNEIGTTGIWNGVITEQSLEKEEVERIKCLCESENCRKQTAYKVCVDKTMIDDIREYIDGLLVDENYLYLHTDYIDLEAEKIKQELGPNFDINDICKVMYEKMKSKDQILHSTLSEVSSFLKIRYYYSKNRVWEYKHNREFEKYRLRRYFNSIGEEATEEMLNEMTKPRWEFH